MAVQVIDSLSETLRTHEGSIYTLHPSDNAVDSAVGQSFTTPASPIYKLHSVVFFLRKTGLNPRTMIARLHAHSGVYGTSSIPTGNPLAQSDSVEVLDITANFMLVIFGFSGSNKILLDPSTHYCIYAFAATGTWNTSNIASFGEVYPSAHPGNTFYFDNGSWKVLNVRDTCFYVYGEEYVTYELTILSSANGVTDPTAGVYEQEAESTLPVLAMPNPGFLFINWFLDAVDVGNENPYTVTFDADHTLEPIFTAVKRGGRKPRIRRRKVEIQVPVMGALAVRSKSALDVEASIASIYRGFWPVQASLIAPFEMSAPVRRVKETSTLRKILMVILRNKT